MLLVITDIARGTAAKAHGKPTCLAAVVCSRSATAGRSSRNLPARRDELRYENVRDDKAIQNIVHV